jgi:GT2 family glycosyltransferase
MDVDISIIIVSYNVKEYLRKCLETIFQHSGSLNVEAIVVDNHSGDGSAEMVRTEFPSVKLIPNDQNNGFSKANNQGIRESKGSYILLLNPDTLLWENTLRTTRDYMDKHPEVGCVGIKPFTASGSVFPNGSSFPAAWKVMGKFLMVKQMLPNRWIRKCFSSSIGRFLSYYASRDVEREVDMVGGFFMFVRRDAIDTVGLMDESYFLEIEDSDWCMRMKRGGWKVMYIPYASFTHLIGKSIDRYRFSKSTFLNEMTNIMRFYSKFYKPINLWVLKISILAGILFQTAFTLVATLFVGRERIQFGEKMSAFYVMMKRVVMFKPL